MRHKKSKSNRETYLENATDILRKGLFKDKGYKVPKVQLSVSWATKGNRTRHGEGVKVLGQCFPTGLCDSGINQVNITPYLDGTSLSGTLRILGVLVHELVHAVDDCASGHGAPFKRCATAVGLTGKMTATTETEWLQDYLKANVIKPLGLFPHAKVLSGGRKDGVRNLKVSCNCCGFSFRTSRKNINLLDDHIECPTGCGGHMDNERDE
mgnify:FL=1